MITLELELDEVNGVLAALGQMPFTQVSGLVAKIQEQALGQVQRNGAAALDATDTKDLAS
jgi:hypothetical protein